MTQIIIKEIIFLVVMQMPVKIVSFTPTFRETWKAKTLLSHYCLTPKKEGYVGLKLNKGKLKVFLFH